MVAGKRERGKIKIDINFVDSLLYAKKYMASAVAWANSYYKGQEGVEIHGRQRSDAGHRKKKEDNLTYSIYIYNHIMIKYSIYIYMYIYL